MAVHADAEQVKMSTVSVSSPCLLGRRLANERVWTNEMSTVFVWFPCSLGRRLANERAWTTRPMYSR